jgi:hypothetical protein
LRLLFTSDIEAVLLTKRQINIDSFEQLIDAKNILPLIQENSIVHTTIVKVSIDFFELYSFSVYFNLNISEYFFNIQTKFIFLFY